MPFGRKLIIRKPRRIETIPFYIDTLIDTPDVDTVAFVIKGENKVGVANQVTNVFAEKGINIVKITVPYPVPADKPSFELTVIAEKCGGDCAEKIAEELKRRVPGVTEVRVYKPYNRLLIIEYHPLIAVGERSIILPETALRGLITVLLSNWGDLAASTSIRKLGRNIGENLYEKLSSYVAGDDYDTLSEIFIRSLQAMGIGIVEILSNTASDGEVIFRIYDNIECRNYGHTGKPMSSLVKGIIEGFYRRLWEKRVVVREEKCLAKGDKYCEFNVSVTL